MRLLHTKDLTLKTFYNDKPQYAILSHTWVEDQEVTFKELTKRRALEKNGWTKIRKFCEIAAAKGYEWCWIDTCCIDKTSSAELQEAINSMYRYYRRSAICIAYLADVPSEASYGSVREWEDIFITSRWFRRAWTLQELLAPHHLSFWASDWSESVGDRTSLRELVERTTCIPTSALIRFSCRNHTAAEIFHWASGRECTREEDHAYSLIGLLDVNMPLLYGEGPKAFPRLQREVLSTHDDESVLLWHQGGHAHSTDIFSPYLDYFWFVGGNLGHGAILATARSTFLRHDLRPLTMTSRGMHAQRKLWRLKGSGSKVIHDCYMEVAASIPGGDSVSSFLRVRPIGKRGPSRSSLDETWPQSDTLNNAVFWRDNVYPRGQLLPDLMEVKGGEYELMILGTQAPETRITLRQLLALGQ